MSTSAPMAKDDPIILAWKKYKESAEFTNTYHWGLHEGHLEGSLWAAFLAGYRALQAIAAPPDVNQELTTDDRPYAYLVVQQQGHIVGAWKDRETAEKIAAQQLARDHEQVVEVYDRPAAAIAPVPRAWINATGALMSDEIFVAYKNVYPEKDWKDFRPLGDILAAPGRELSEEDIARHSLKAGECPPQSEVMLVSSLRRLGVLRATGG